MNYSLCLLPLLLFFRQSLAGEVPVVGPSVDVERIPYAPEKSDTGIAPIWGYRFMVEGDFDGDGRRDTLTERFVSTLDGKETNKFYNTDNYDTIVALTEAKKPRSFAVSSNPRIDTLQIAENPQLLGLAFFKNEGDLNGDGTDEVSWVPNWADWSSMNTCYVMSWTTSGWQTLLAFGIHDWELPALPDVQMSYGYFGVDGTNSTLGDDSTNAMLEDEIRKFGLIEKVENGLLRIHTYATEDTDSISIGESVVRTVRMDPLINASSHSR